MRLPFYVHANPAPHAWVDPVTGVTVKQSGGRYTTRNRRGGVPTLTAHLAAAQDARIGRLFVCGAIPESWTNRQPSKDWAISKRGHFIDSADPRLSFTNARTGWSVEIRTAAVWFGGPVDPNTACSAWVLLLWLLAQAFDKDTTAPVLLATPASSGRQMLAALRGDWPDPVPDDISELIRSTSPQHRIEVVGTCYGGCDQHRPQRAEPATAVACLDARFAYASMVRELGVGVVGQLTGQQAHALADANPYARARFDVTFKVPDGWSKPGLLMVKHPDGQHWHTPSLPGVAARTWADAAEVALARSNGWPVIFHEGLTFGKALGNPLDRWAARLVKVWAELRGHEGEPAALAAAAVRNIVLHTLGGFHSAGRESAHLAPSPLHVPQLVTARRDNPDGTVTYYTREKVTGSAAAFMRPELTSQIWARAHVRLATNRQRAGYLHLPDVWAMQGDALYVPTASIPGDLLTDLRHDQRNIPGRYRVKGEALATDRHPLVRPGTVAELAALRVAS